MTAWRGPARRISPRVMESDPWTAWLEPDEDGYDRPEIACPCCGLRIGTGGRKGWLVRRLKAHFAACRPRFRVYRRWEADRLENAVRNGGDLTFARWRAGMEAARRRKASTADRERNEEEA